MHETQAKILDLARLQNIAAMPLRTIGKEIGLGENNARLVQHHIEQLVKKGFLWVDRKAGKMRLLSEGSSTDLMRIPILGAADCGVATQYATNTQPEGYLPISGSLLGLKRNKAKAYFAVRAVGNSMNKARVTSFGGEKTGIDDGDLVLVDSSQRLAEDGSYIVAVIDGLANIKKLVRGNGVAILQSESTVSHTPIYLDPELQDFIAGKVVAVVKG